MPTVVVARRPRPGAEAALESALRDVIDVAGTAPGFVGAQVQPPDAAHPGECVVVYRFTTFDALEEWLRSPARAAAMAAVEPLVDGPAREQVVAVPTPSDPVTAVSSATLRPGAADAYRAHHRRVLRALQQVEGFRRAELLDPVDGRQDEVVTVLVFDDRASLDRWLGSEVRRELLEAMAPLVEGDRSVNVVGGWAGWFAPGGAERGPRRWKQALVVLAALFPVSLGIGALRQALLPDLALLPSTLLGNVIGIALLTWLLMPWLTRWLAGWLRR